MQSFSGFEKKSTGAYNKNYYNNWTFFEKLKQSSSFNNIFRSNHLDLVLKQRSANGKTSELRGTTFCIWPTFIDLHCEIWNYPISSQHAFKFIIDTNKEIALQIRKSSQTVLYYMRPIYQRSLEFYKDFIQRVTGSVIFRFYIFKTVKDSVWNKSNNVPESALKEIL